MKRTYRGPASAHRSGWWTLFSCTALAGCSVTTPLPLLDQPAAVQSKAPERALLAQVGFGSSAQFVRCLPAACPRPTPKTLARLRPASAQTLPANRPPNPAAPAHSTVLPRPPQDAAAGALPPVDHVHRLSARDQVTTIQPRSSPPTSAQQVVTILFMPASARIGPDGHARLVAAPVQGATRLIVRGAADPTGNAGSNLRLARSRAQAVAAQLRAIHPSLRHVRIDVVADGNCCGQAGQGSDATHARRRSVEIVIERQEPDP